MMNKEQKKQYINDMTTQFDKTEAVIVTHYQGLTVNQLDDLRKKMREHGIKFKITNNRITKLALEKEKSNLTIKGDLVSQAFITSTMGVSYKIKLEKSL
jgi:ribosomal protein L10